MRKLKGLMDPEKFQDKIEPPKEVAHLRRRVKELEANINAMREGEGEFREMLRALSDTVEAVQPLQKEYIPPKKPLPIRHPVEAVMGANDWHYGAVQNADEIEGINAFSPEIAESRILNHLVPDYLKWIEIKRLGYPVNDLRILCLGDMVSGDIHDELRVTNAFPMPVQVVKSAFLFADMVAGFAPYFENITVEMVTSDNHGRLTQRLQAKDQGLNSVMYIYAFLVKERLKAHKNVTINIYPMLQTVIDIQGFRTLITHGHTVRAWAGISFYGIERKVGLEARKRQRVQERKLREALRFDRLIMGHLHVSFNAEDWTIFPSLSGTDAYDHNNNRFALPSQAGFMVHPEKGMFDWTTFRFN